MTGDGIKKLSNYVEGNNKKSIILSLALTLLSFFMTWAQDISYSKITGDIYEAEDAVIYLAVIEIKNPGYHGKAYINYDKQPGGFIEFTVKVNETGEYYIVFTYAHGGSDGPRIHKVEVNGGVVMDNLVMVSTGGWSSFKQTGLTTNLKAGENKIRLTGTSAIGGANIDYLIVAKK